MDEFRFFREKMTSQRVPFAGQIAITCRCNLHCVHCYSAGISAREQDKERWTNIISQLAGEGCLFLVMTGGEPLLRDDFSEIYSHAVEKGILVTVFTNLTMLNRGHVSMFKEYIPQEVETTLLGAKKETHDFFTGVTGSFEKTIQGIHDLLDNGIRVSLKTILMKGNSEEAAGVQKIAEKFGINFRLDGLVFASLTGNKTPLSYRIEPSEIIRMEMSDEGRLTEWKSYYSKFGDVSKDEPLFRCSAGETCFYIDPGCFLNPCVMVPYVRVDTAGGFRKAWDEVGRIVKSFELPESSPCNGCKYKGICGYCPGIFHLEGTTAESPPEFLCELGKTRYNYLSNTCGVNK